MVCFLSCQKSELPVPGEEDSLSVVSLRDDRGPEAHRAAWIPLAYQIAEEVIHLQEGAYLNPKQGLRVMNQVRDIIQDLENDNAPKARKRIRMLRSNVESLLEKQAFYPSAAQRFFTLLDELYASI